MSLKTIKFDRERAIEIFKKFPKDIPMEQGQALEDSIERTRQNFFQIIFQPISAELGQRCEANDLYMYVSIRDKINYATDEKLNEITFSEAEFNYFSPKILDFKHWSPNLADLIIWMIEIIKSLKGEYVPEKPEKPVSANDEKPATKGKKNVN